MLARTLVFGFVALAACSGSAPSRSTPVEIDGGSVARDGGADASAVDAGAADAGTMDAGIHDAGLPPAGRRLRYPHDAVLSPIDESTANAWHALRDGGAGDGLRDDVFMKVGASGTVSTLLLYCFAANPSYPYRVDLAGRDDLSATIAHFRAGNAAGRTPFDRASLAAEVGRSAVWAIAGTPSPIEREVDAIHPRFAFVNYGTNDMGLGSTPETALWPFYENLSRLLDQLMTRRILPIVTGLNPRSDSQQLARWVPTYNEVTRGVAEALGVPFINLFLASAPLPNLGLVSDGIHGNTYRDAAGRAEPCVFTAEALLYNYNTRNLASLVALDRVRRVVLEGASAPDPAGAAWPGSGAPADPFLIDRLPYTHAYDTRASPHRRFDRYPSCDRGQDESGPEVLYRLDLVRETPVRAMVFDRAGVDVDLHLLDGSASAQSCTARNDRIIQRRLSAGTHHFSVDTFTSASSSAGPYLFVVVECEAGDPACE
jgi:hypothetical protein